jgi:hypothetical protein
LWSKVILTQLPAVKPLKWFNWLSIFVVFCISVLLFMLFVLQIDTANSKRLIIIFPNGIELGTSVNVTIKSASFSVKGPNQYYFTPPPLPEPYEEKSGHLKLFYHDSDLNPIPRASYRVEFEDGTMREGVLDDNGEARLEDTPPGQADIYFGYSTDEPILPKIVKSSQLWLLFLFCPQSSTASTILSAITFIETGINHCVYSIRTYFQLPLARYSCRQKFQKLLLIITKIQLKNHV